MAELCFRLYGLEPDRSVTGGAWYTDQEFESEFVEILNQQSYNYLYDKLEKSRQAGATTGPMAARSMSMATSKEVAKYISDLGISKIDLKQEDIEAILDTLIYDGKLEKTTKVKDGQEIKVSTCLKTPIFKRAFNTNLFFSVLPRS